MNEPSRNRAADDTTRVGVGTYFGLPGDGIDGPFGSPRQHWEQVRFVHCRHEEASSLVAVGHAKFGGRLAAFWCGG